MRSAILPPPVENIPFPKSSTQDRAAWEVQERRPQTPIQSQPSTTDAHGGVGTGLSAVPKCLKAGDHVHDVHMPWPTYAHMCGPTSRLQMARKRKALIHRWPGGPTKQWSAQPTRTHLRVRDSPMPETVPQPIANHFTCKDPRGSHSERRARVGSTGIVFQNTSSHRIRSLR